MRDTTLVIVSGCPTLRAEAVNPTIRPGSQSRNASKRGRKCCLSVVTYTTQRSVTTHASAETAVGAVPPVRVGEAGGSLADLLTAYRMQNSPDAAAKDACTGLSKMTNPLPGAKEKAETCVVVQSVQSSATQGAIG